MQGTGGGWVITTGDLCTNYDFVFSTHPLWKKKADKNTKTNKAHVSKEEPIWDKPVSFTYVKQ